MKSIIDTFKPFIPPFIKRPIEKLINPNWHRNAVGGLWEEIGKLQFDFLVARGLKPEHYFLDVGCGSLRGGIHFIQYLERGHYFGIDKSKELLDAGRNIELKRCNLMVKNPTLVQMDNFDFQSLNQKFDYALAQSVFAHLPLSTIIRCIMNIEKVLVQEGQFYTTFFENPRGKFNLDPIVHPHGVTTHFDKDAFHYDFETFQWVCKGTKLKVEYIGNWNHPTNQMMMVFTKI